MTAFGWSGAAPSRLVRWLIVAAVLAGTALLAQHPSARLLMLVALPPVAALLLAQPALGPIVVVAAALIAPIEFSTGTDVNLNPVTLLVPFLIVLWLAAHVRRRQPAWGHSRCLIPLLLFLLAALISLLAGNATWDPLVPRSSQFILVQLGQWAIFAFSAGAFVLSANTIRQEAALQRLTNVFLVIAGSLAVASVLLGARGLVNRVATLAIIRTPFWMLLAALAGGQLLFNRQLGRVWRIACLACIAATVAYAFVQEQEAVSNWLGVGVVVIALVWLRLPRLRWLITAAVLVLTVTNILYPTLYNFAGGDSEWHISGGSRLALIERVVTVTMRNPLTGLGPAAYRLYANMQPLAYGSTYWLRPDVSSHNNYVDIFAHTGLIGLGLFLWFMAEVGLLGWRLRKHYRTGFSSGYVNAMLAAWVGMLVVMVVLDWFVPFVYNVGFPGFQASVLVWLFLGGLAALEAMTRDAASPGDEESVIGT